MLTTTKVMKNTQQMGQSETLTSNQQLTPEKQAAIQNGLNELKALHAQMDAQVDKVKTQVDKIEGIIDQKPNFDNWKTAAKKIVEIQRAILENLSQLIMQSAKSLGDYKAELKKSLLIDLNAQIDSIKRYNELAASNNSISSEEIYASEKTEITPIIEAVLHLKEHIDELKNLDNECKTKEQALQQKHQSKESISPFIKQLEAILDKQSQNSKEREMLTYLILILRDNITKDIGKLIYSALDSNNKLKGLEPLSVSYTQRAQVIDRTYNVAATALQAFRNRAQPYLEATKAVRLTASMAARNQQFLPVTPTTKAEEAKAARNHQVLQNTYTIRI